MDVQTFIEVSKNWKKYRVLKTLPDIGTSHAILVGEDYYSGTIYDAGYNINKLISDGYIELNQEPYEWQKELVGKNRRTVYSYCPQCRSFGVNIPLNNECGNCGYANAVTYYDANTINDLLNNHQP